MDVLEERTKGKMRYEKRKKADIHFNIPTHLCLGLPNGLFPSGFPRNILYAFLLAPIRAT
jgi:hypothetical protein